jgi:ATP-dependent Clp protease adaptor protein ClpS
MPEVEAPTLPNETLPVPVVRPASVPHEQTEVRRQPPYAVILHNDDINGMDFVVGVLRKVFSYGRMKSIWLMLKAHSTGRAIVWSGSLEVAELKADQMRSCGPDPSMKQRGAVALSVSIEPLPI